MKILLISALTAVLSFPASATACDKPAKSPEARTMLMLDADVDATEVYLGGKFIGTTPLQYEIASGDFELEFRKKGYESWARKLHVPERGSTRVKATMNNPATR